MSTCGSDTEREEREWEAQESALRAERTGPGGDASVAQYRLVARALREPPLAPLPSDFAAQTAALVRRTSRGASERVEIWLERGLVALLLLAGAAALLIYNGDWLRELSFSVPERAAFGVQAVASWSIAVAACVGISSALALARKP